MNFKRKWQGQLMKQLRERNTVELHTRDSRELGYLTEMEQEGKIEVVSREGGKVTLRLSESAQEARPRIAGR